MAQAVKPWFKAKKYGWGWTPQTFEGYLTLLIFITLFTGLTIIFIKRINDPLFAPVVSIIIYAVLLAVLISSLIFICYLKGEKPSWRWPASPKLQRGEGNKKKK